MCAACALQDFNRVWKGLESMDCQRMSLVWETDELLALNSSIISFLKDQACSLFVCLLPLSSDIVMRDWLQGFTSMCVHAIQVRAECSVHMLVDRFEKTFLDAKES